MIFSSYIYIHSWGGLGSQLFALAFVLKSSGEFPHRNFVLVHHTSGVTRRLLETTLFRHFHIKYQVVDDFRQNSQKEQEPIVSISKLIKPLMISILKRLRFIVIQDNEEEVRFHSRTVAIRGHYYRSPLSENVIGVLSNYFLGLARSTAVAHSRYRDTTFIHYRLGDLLTLEEKSPIPTERLSAILEKVSLLGFSKFVIDSDSPEIAISNVKTIIDRSINGSSVKISLFSGSLLQFISNGIEANVFVGTNSKISIWIALFRAYKSVGMTFLPREIAADFYKISPNSTLVSFY